MPENHSYKAIVKGNVINWPEGIPPELKDDSSHEAIVTLSENEEEQLERSKKLAEILAQLAKLDPFRDIKDPVEWQREIRRDRPLYGRD